MIFGAQLTLFKKTTFTYEYTYHRSFVRLHSHSTIGHGLNKVLKLIMHRMNVPYFHVINRGKTVLWLDILSRLCPKTLVKISKAAYISHKNTMRKLCTGVHHCEWINEYEGEEKKN